jgi:hypothetical protein
MGKGALPGDPLYPVHQDIICNASDISGSGDQGILNVTDLTGYAFRFDSFSLSKPITGALGESINNYFKDEILKGSLNVLLAVDKDDRTKGILEMSVGPGKTAGDGYQFEGEAGKLGCKLNGAHFITDTPSSLKFPNNLLEPPSLPINQLKLSGFFTPDAQAIENGVLEGVLTGTDAKNIKIAGSAFYDLLTGLGIFPDIDTDNDQKFDSWSFLGSFTAVETKLH